jgi:transcription antitermination factor NusG
MSEPYWAIAVTQSNRDDFVQQMLKRQGFESYRPRIKTEKKNIASLFPGYLMVRVIVRWYPIRWCPGVLKLLMAGDQPAKLADHIVTAIQQREVKGFVKLPKLEPGTPVRITSGTFTGFMGIYDGMSGPQRQRVLLDLLGQKVPVTLARGSIELV